MRQIVHHCSLSRARLRRDKSKANRASLLPFEGVLRRDKSEANRAPLLPFEGVPEEGTVSILHNCFHSNVPEITPVIVPFKHA